MQREHFTKHGLHMNGAGKDQLSRLLTLKILELFDTQPTVTPIRIPWKDKAVTAEDEQKSITLKDSTLTCPEHQSNGEVVQHSQDTNHFIDNEQGSVPDFVNNAHHSSLAKPSARNLIKCDDRVIPTNAPITDDKKSSRLKKTPLPEVMIFLWL